MKYFVYYDAGSCNDGSHTNGLEEFDDRVTAERRVDELLKEPPFTFDFFTIKLLEGSLIQELTR